MNPSDFRFLLKNFTTLTSAEYAQLQNLSIRYPYSQLLHVMRARASKDLRAQDHISFLHRTAVYATDRSVVKWAMVAPATARLEAINEAADDFVVVPSPPEIAEVPLQKTASVLGESATATLSPGANPLEGDALRNDLVIELKKLQQLKHDFEASYESLKYSMQGEKNIIDKEIATKEPPLLEEIKPTRKKLKVATNKALDQNEIIDQFIKASPTLPKPKPTAPSTDLAEDSVSYSDNIVSETLVAILLKQGKKVKAIEMLKKLIWKFPQKKAYFAAQIEALKN